MIKEIVISTISVIAIIIGNNTTNEYAKESMKSTSDEIQNLRNIIAIEEVKQEDAKSKIDELFNNWKEKQNKLAYFIEHDELEKIEQGLTEIQSNIEMEEYQEAVVKSDSTIFILGHIEDKLAVKLENIF